MHTKKYRINKSDHYRTLVTETLPAEVPIVFSNDGFYANCKLSILSSSYPPKELVTLILGSESDNSFTVPFNYKIRKNELEVRCLSLIHPRTQIRMAEFYKKYDSLICHYTSKSDASLRSPSKISGTYYIKNEYSDLNKYKNSSTPNSYEDLIFRHSSSYFTYRGFRKIHKFYDSVSFNNYESRFPLLWTADVSKCFDSIYTHSIAWACKGKEFSKSNVKISSTFANDFDSLMQRSNYNETNGIVIGPEISRIFSEIIFQEIDATAFKKAKEKGLISGSDFIFKRYVDDCFIFAKNEDIAKKFYEIYSDSLNLYKLHINIEKVSKKTRPFTTKKSNIILQTNKALTEYFDSFIETSLNANIKKYQPKKIFRPKSLVLNFINNIKSICSQNDSSYDSISSYIISACTKRIQLLIDQETIQITEDMERNFKECFIALLEVIFYFYKVSPTVNSSYTLAKSILLSCGFFEEKLANYESELKNLIFQNAIQIFSDDSIHDISNRENYLSLEKINLLLSIGNLGTDYLIDESNIIKIFDLNGITEKHTYLHLISCLYYTKDHSKYKKINAKINQICLDKFYDFGKIHTKSDLAHLFFDLLSCPYINHNIKKNLINSFYTFSSKKKLIGAQLTALINFMEKNPWFVNWESINLLNMLERKELMKAYS